MENFPFLLVSGDIAFRFLNYANGQQDVDIGVPYDFTTNYNPDESTSSSESSDDSDGLLGNQSQASHVTVCDINQSMLEVGKSRAPEAGIYSGMILFQPLWMTLILYLFYIL